MIAMIAAVVAICEGVMKNVLGYPPMLSTLIIDKERSARKENTCCMKVYQALVYF